MKCQTCGVEMAGKGATLETPYVYTLSGLKNVQLVGISVFKCEGCGDEVPVIPRVGELHQQIAKSLAQKESLLRGEEIRFLRKNAGMPANDFAALLGVTSTYLSKIENGHLQLSPAADKLARIVSTAACESERMREVLLDVANTLKPVKKVRALQKPIFKLERNRWLQAVA